MALYWVTFRLKADATYQARYGAMIIELDRLRQASWGEPTSFWAVRTTKGLDDLVRSLAKPLNPKTDLLAAGTMHAGNVAYIGVLEHPTVFKDIFPPARKLG